MNSISTVNSSVVYAELTKAVTRLAGTVVKDPYQLAALHFIADRTFTFQKLSEVIPVRHFLGGVQRKRGGMVCAGLGMSEAKLFAVLRASREAGILLTTKVGRRVRYALNLQWVISLAPPAKREVVAAALTFEDLAWGTAEVREKPHTMEVLPPENLHEVEVHLKEHCPLRAREETKGEAVAPRYAGPEFLIGREQEKTAPDLPPAKIQEDAPRAKRKRKAAEPHPVTLFDAFEDKARAMWPDMTVFHPMVGKQQWKLRALARSWAHPEVPFKDFLVWCAENWRGVWASKFRFVQSKDPTFRMTEYPDLATLIYFHRAFTDAFMRRDSQRIRAGLTRRDNLIRRHMWSGFSHADAEREADEALAKEKCRDDQDERARKLNEGYRRLERERQDPAYRRAIARVRSEMYAEANPVKPVSLTRAALRPTFAYINEPLKPLSSFPTWKDEPEDDASQGDNSPTTHVVAA